MKTDSNVERVRYRYPARAILLVIGAWSLVLLNLVLFTWGLMWMALFPIAPAVIAGFACLVGPAHTYAISVRRPVAKERQSEALELLAKRSAHT